MNMIALVENEPRVLTLKAILSAYLKHRQEVVMRRIAHELINALHRGHILEGLKIALDNLDDVIATIRQSKDADAAKENLMKKFKLSEIQAAAILEMQLRRLAALEREKIIEEYNQILATIAEYKSILATPTHVVEIIKTELLQLKEVYGDKRRTKVHKGKPGEISDEELIKAEETVVVLSRGGYVKRVSPLSFRTQGRGGKGVSGGNLKEEDVIQIVTAANTHDQILFFTSKGRVFTKRIWDIPESSRIARGTPIVNFIGVDMNERITSILTMRAPKPEGRKTK
jgi:DNA gyrase subunit A